MNLSVAVRFPIPSGRCVLVIEDNPMDLDLMLQAFQEHNIANPIRVCRDGEEALQFIEAHTSPEDPDLPLLVLLDLRLPKIDGIEVFGGAPDRIPSGSEFPSSSSRPPARTRISPARTNWAPIPTSSSR